MNEWHSYDLVDHLIFMEQQEAEAASQAAGGGGGDEDEDDIGAFFGLGGLGSGFGPRLGGLGGWGHSRSSRQSRLASLPAAAGGASSPSPAMASSPFARQVTVAARTILQNIPFVLPFKDRVRLFYKFVEIDKIRNDDGKIEMMSELS